MDVLEEYSEDNVVIFEGVDNKIRIDEEMKKMSLQCIVLKRFFRVKTF